MHARHGDIGELVEAHDERLAPLGVAGGIVMRRAYRSQTCTAGDRDSPVVARKM